MRYSKYRAKPTFVDGLRFASKKEAARYKELKLLLHAGEIFHLSRQDPFDLMVEGKIIGKYVSDFMYNTKDGDLVIEDVKGMKTPLYLWKRRHFEAQYRIKIKET